MKCDNTFLLHNRLLNLNLVAMTILFLFYGDCQCFSFLSRINKIRWKLYYLEHASTRDHFLHRETYLYADKITSTSNSIVFSPSPHWPRLLLKSIVFSTSHNNLYFIIYGKTSNTFFTLISQYHIHYLYTIKTYLYSNTIYYLYITIRYIDTS